MREETGGAHVAGANRYQARVSALGEIQDRVGDKNTKASGKRTGCERVPTDGCQRVLLNDPMKACLSCVKDAT